MKHKRILIVGAGITGCTLAALLEQRGVVPTIVDSARQSDPNGFGISIMPRGLAVLEQLGIRPAMEQAGTILHGCKLFDERGNELTTLELVSAGIESITLDRHDLLKLLRSELKRSKIRWQTTIKKLEEKSDGTAVTFTDGRTEIFDLVIGADGLNSGVRSKIFPAVKPEKVGAGIWMLAVPQGCKLEDRESAHFVFGDYRFMAVFPYKNTGVAALTMPLAADVNPKRIDVAEAFAGMSEETDRILQVVKKAEVYASHLRQIKLKNWYRGRVVLAGDAAHAMIPATGMGASNGIQDAAVLARLIVAMPIELFDALPSRYQRLQKPLTDAKQREAYLMGHVMLMNKYPAAVRNKVFELIPRALLGKAVVRQ